MCKITAYHWTAAAAAAAAAAVAGKDSVTIGAENIAAGKAFGPEDITGPVSSK